MPGWSLIRKVLFLFMSPEKNEFMKNMDNKQLDNNDHLKAFDETYFQRAAYAEVSFEKYSQYWWSNRFYAALAKKFGPKSGRVLEVGTGMGHLLTWFNPESYHVFGSDINPWALEKARQNVPTGDFRILNAEDLSNFSDSYFQIIISKHVVEHLQDPKRSVDEMCRILAPGGLLLLVTPNLDSPMRAYKKEKWIGYRDPTHISLKPPADWLNYIKSNCLVIKKVFSDGFWDAPYIPILPKMLQKIIFGGPGGLQAILGWSIIPICMGESLIILASKP
jgi:2-polyprenyl-3-methyl-5-hydroxy-6-metoxy-1,4-benzoquinol methylase